MIREFLLAINKEDPHTCTNAETIEKMLYAAGALDNLSTPEMRRSMVEEANTYNVTSLTFLYSPLTPSPTFQKSERIADVMLRAYSWFRLPSTFYHYHCPGTYSVNRFMIMDETVFRMMRVGTKSLNTASKKEFANQQYSFIRYLLMNVSNYTKQLKDLKRAGRTEDQELMFHGLCCDLGWLHAAYANAKDIKVKLNGTKAGNLTPQVPNTGALIDQMDTVEKINQYMQTQMKQSTQFDSSELIDILPPPNYSNNNNSAAPTPAIPAHTNKRDLF